MKCRKKPVQIKAAAHGSSPSFISYSPSAVSLRKRPKKTEEELRAMRETLMQEQSAYMRSKIW